MSDIANGNGMYWSATDDTGCFDFFDHSKKILHTCSDQLHIFLQLTEPSFVYFYFTKCGKQPTLPPAIYIAKYVSLSTRYLALEATPLNLL